MSKIKTHISKIKKDKHAMDLLKGGGLVLFFKVLGALSGYFFTVIVARRFDAATYGVFELSFTILMIATVLVRLGLDTASVRFNTQFMVEQKFGKIKSLYKNSLLAILATSLVVGALVYIFKGSIGAAFQAEGLSDALFWVAICILPFGLMQFNSENMRGFKAMKLYAIYQQGSVFLIGAFIFILIPKESLTPRTQAIIAFFAATIIMVGLSFISYAKTFKAKVGKVILEKINFQAILQVSLPLMISSSLFLIMSWTDTLMIGYFKTEADVGIYRVAFKIATLITFTQFAVNSIAAPTIAQHYSSKNMEGLKKYIHQIGWVNLALSLPIFIGIIVFKTPLLNLFGAEFTGGAGIIVVLAVGQLVNALCGPVLYILNMTGKEKLTKNIMLWITLLNFGLNAWLIPKYGILGAAIATSLGMMAWNIIAAFWVYRYYKIIAFPWFKR